MNYVQLVRFISIVAVGNWIFYCGAQPNQMVVFEGNDQVVPQACQDEEGHNQLMLKGCLNVLGSENKIPSFQIFFKGEETHSDEEGFFTLPTEERDITKNDGGKYTLVICKNIEKKIDGKNTLKNLSIIPGKDYVAYSFKKSHDEEGEWVQEKKNLDVKNRRIPKRAVIVVVDPKYVARVEPWKIKLEGNFVKLPKIMLKNNLPQKKSLARAATRSLLNSLDATPFHERVKRVTQVPSDNEKAKISIIQ